MFYAQVDTLIIATMLPASAVALYDAPKKLLPLIRLFSMTISKVLFPKLSAINDINQQYNKKRKQESNNNSEYRKGKTYVPHSNRFI